MRLGDFYQTCVRIGWAHDVHSRETVDEQLADARREYEALPERHRRFFDREHRLYRPGNQWESAIHDYYVEVDAEIGRTIDAANAATHTRAMEAASACTAPYETR